MSEAEQQAARGVVSNATPLHLGGPAILGPKLHAGQTLAQHLDDVAIVADLLLLALDRAPGASE